MLKIFKMVNCLKLEYNTIMLLKVAIIDNVFGLFLLLGVLLIDHIELNIHKKFDYVKVLYYLSLWTHNIFISV